MNGPPEGSTQLQDFVAKANVLLEALPYIRRFADKVFVIKYGGHAMVDESLKRSFARDIVLMKYIGMKPVVVHGGGPQIKERLAKFGVKSEFVNGMRVTDHETMVVVEEVLAGHVNKEIVTLIHSQGGRAVGISGKDGGLITASKMLMDDGNGNQRDIGFVGRIDHVDPKIIRTLVSDKFIPVIAPVGADENGQAYNINADIVAGKVAAALKAEKLILMTDVIGVMNEAKELIHQLNAEQVKALIESGVIKGGMIPKVNCCLDALQGGVRKTHIIDGRVQHACLLEIFTEEGIGTEISWAPVRDKQSQLSLKDDA